MSLPLYSRETSDPNCSSWSVRSVLGWRGWPWVAIGQNARIGVGMPWLPSHPRRRPEWSCFQEKSCKRKWRANGVEALLRPPDGDLTATLGRWRRSFVAISNSLRRETVTIQLLLRQDATERPRGRDNRLQLQRSVKSGFHDCHPYSVLSFLRNDVQVFAALIVRF